MCSHRVDRYICPWSQNKIFLTIMTARQATTPAIALSIQAGTGSGGDNGGRADELAEVED